MRYLVLSLLVGVGCGTAPESEEVLEDMECVWSEDVQECFCYSTVDGDSYFTWAPPSACLPSFVDEPEG